MLVLLIFTHPQPGIKFFLFLITCFIVGFVSEVIGINTGYLFGDYTYSQLLGPSIAGVPLIIGINWFIVIYCCGMFMKAILNKFSPGDINQGCRLKIYSLVIDGAILAVVFDWIMEPVAISLGFWKWQGDIPVFNYISWFLVSIVLLLFFHAADFRTTNKFAVNLLLIQILFFLILRSSI